jgi:hypothetical protein
MTHRLSSWIVGPDDRGGSFNAFGAAQVYSGGTSTVGLSWSGLPLGGRFVGALQFRDLGGMPQATTAVRVETNGGLPLAVTPVPAWAKDEPAQD